MEQHACGRRDAESLRPSGLPVEATARERPPGGLEELIARLAQGDGEALAALYDATSSRVYGWALRVLRDHASADEATLDTYAQVWRTAAEYDPRRGSALAWILTVARTRAIDQRRARSRRAGDAPLDHVAEIPDVREDPEAILGAAEDAARVRRALARLPADQRGVLEVAYFSGLSHSETAERMGLPLGTVKTRIRLGLRALERHLTSDGTTTSAGARPRAERRQGLHS